MKGFFSPLRILLLAALLAGTALGIRPVTQAHADSVITVTIMDDDTDSGDGCSLREAIINANNNALTHPDCIIAGSGDDTIVFADGVGTILLNAGLPGITDLDGLTIDGGGDVTIHGHYTYGLFHVFNAPLTFDSLNLFGGYDSVGGAAVMNVGGTVTVTRSVFYYNEGHGGGAINNQDGTLTVANSLFLENFSDDPNGYGGAVFTFGDGRIVTLTNNTFSGNRAASGGDLYVSSGTPKLVNNIFADSCYLSGSNTLASGHHNLFQDAASACGFTNGVDGNLLGVDPAFDPGNFYGIALQSTSPIIDKGDDTACAQYPVSLNGLPRPQGIHCDIGAYEYPQTLIRKYIVSTAAQDGWVLESTATSSVGGSRSSAGSTIPIGDTAQKQQRVGIFSFDLGATGGLPAPQDLVSVSLWLKPAGYCGTTSPFPSLGNLLVDVRKGSFANNSALQVKDFQALATKKAAWSLDGTLTDGWLMKQLSPADFQYLNYSVTQIRVRFAKGNNSNARADCLKIYSSEEPTHLMQPQLVVDYYVR
jgi:CSLREA domain-containing protein